MPLVKDYGTKLIDPVPFEPMRMPSRFLTYQWITILKAFRYAPALSSGP